MNHAIHELLKRPIAFQPAVAKALDSIPLAILWGQLYYWTDRTTDPDGWIYKTVDDITDETSLTRKQQTLAKKLGMAMGILEIRRAGKTGVNHFRINFENTEKIVSDFIEKQNYKPVKGQNKLFNPLKKIKEVRETFCNQLKPFINSYSPLMIEKFTDYWSEKNKHGRERWQMEKTWEIDRLLKKWKRQQEEWDWQKTQRKQLQKVDEQPVHRDDVGERKDAGFEGVGNLFGKYKQ